MQIFHYFQLFVNMSRRKSSIKGKIEWNCAKTMTSRSIHLDDISSNGICVLHSTQLMGRMYLEIQGNKHFLKSSVKNLNSIYFGSVSLFIFCLCHFDSIAFSSDEKLGEKWIWILFSLFCFRHWHKINQFVFYRQQSFNCNCIFFA